MRSRGSKQSAQAVFAGSGEATSLARSVDWSATALGPVETWPKSLCSAVRLCLDSLTPTAIWAGADFTLIHNEGYASVLGKKHPLAMGRPAREVWAEVWHALESEFRQVLETGVSTRHVDALFRLRRRDREEEAYFTYTLNPIREEDGRVVGLLNICEETTGSVRSRTESEEFLAYALGTARVGAWDLDLFDHTSTRSPEHDLIFGYEHQLPEWTYEMFLEHVLPEDRGEVDRRFRHAAETRSDWTFECRIRTVAGEVRWIWAAGRHRVDPGDGRHTKMAGIVQDITERKRAEETLEVRDAQFRALVEELHSGVALIDATGKFSLYNRRFLAMFGLAQDSDIKNVNDQDWGAWKVFDESGRLLEVDQHRVRKAAMTRLTVRDELVGVRLPSGGDLKWLLVSAEPLLDKYGSVEQIICTYHDVTDLKRAESALREADRRKDEFLGMLSHELRNPLAPIRNSIYILSHAEAGGEQAHRARVVIQRQTEHLTRLVDDLLDVTRIARGKIELRRDQVDIADIVRRTAEDLRAGLADHQLKLTVEVPETRLWVFADEVRVAQVLGNLLQNAAKFTSAPGEVWVSVQGSDSAVEVRVRDTGVGIEPRLLAQIFEPFFQLETSLARTKGGLGLGLALVKGIVELHGGTVRAESAGPGQGAEFVIRLPVGAVPEERRVPTGTPRSNHVRRVLVVDDNSDAAESLAQIVELLGHSTDVVYDGPSAIRMAEATRYDVILCDIGLPAMSGYEVAAALRKGPAKDAQIIAVSGYAQPEDLARAADAGFDGHVAKPPDPDKIARLLT